MVSTAVYRLCGRASIGPSGVATQTWTRMRSAISPVQDGHEFRFKVALIAQVHPARAIGH